MKNNSIYEEAISTNECRNGSCSRCMRNNYPTTNYNYIPRSNNLYRNNNFNNNSGERIFWAPFAIGGLAGTALGYGLANNNQLNNNWGMGQPVYWVPRPVPYYNNFNNNFYY